MEMYTFKSTSRRMERSLFHLPSIVTNITLSMLYIFLYTHSVHVYDVKFPANESTLISTQYSYDI